MKLLYVFVLLFFVPNISALDLESAKEQTCFPIKKTVEPDIKWIMSVKEWYYPLMSRLDLYIAGLELSENDENFRNLKESQLYYDSCIKGEFGEKALHVTGFGGKRINWTLGPPTVTTDGVTYQNITLESGSVGLAYTTLTDNSTFSFLVVCWDDNQISWGVTSTVAKLPKETVKNIYGHAESLGFKSEYFEELRYGYCEDENKSKSVEHETCTK